MAVPGLDVGVANRPIDGDPFAQVRFEIEITPAVGLASPHDGTAADLPSANPAEGLALACRIRIFRVVDKKFGRPLIAGVARALDGLVFQLPAAITHAAELHIPGWDVFDIILLGDGGTARLQH